MLDSRLLIHIGYPKTASTWLQQIIFSNKQFGLLAPWGALSFQAIEQFVVPDSFHFNAESVKKVFEPGLKEAYEHNLVPVLSHEELIGHITKTALSKEVADRIYAVFPQAKILIIIREQKAMLLSSYRQHIKNGGTKKLEEFVGNREYTIPFRPICRLDRLEYDLLIKYYQDLFGGDNVLVLPFELLKNNQQSFIEKILNFVGLDKVVDYQSTPKNIGYKGGKLILQRQFNFFSQPPTLADKQSSLRWLISCKLSSELAKFIPQSIHESIEKDWQNFIVKRVGDYFRESNRKTSLLIDTNLAEFDYDC